MEKYNLTYPQKNIWLVEKYSGTSPINSIVGTIEIKDKFDEKMCIDAINYIIKSNDAMRFCINENNENVEQYVKEYEWKNIKVHDLSSYTLEEVNNFKEKLAKMPLDISKNELFEFCLLRYSKNSGAIFMRVHHIISDAWSCSKIGTDIVNFLSAKLNNEEFIEENRPSYIEYINSEKEYESSEKYQKDKAFWEEYLSNVEEPASLKPIKENTSKEARRYSVTLNDKENEKINKYCKENKISPYALFLSAISTYIYRVREISDFIIGTPVLNRANFKEKNMVGMFVSTLPLRVNIKENEKFVELAQNISTNNLSLFRHQKYPYSKSLEFVRKNQDIKSNLYNIVLSYQNARANMGQNSIYSTTWVFSETINDELEIHIMDMDSTGRLNINYDYMVELFNEIEIKYLHTRLMAIIFDAINDIDVDLENIHIMSNEEENKIIYDFNNTVTDYPKDKTLIELFKEQVSKTPNMIALVFEEKSMTYKELDEKSNRIAHFLNQKDICKNDVVGIMMNKSMDMICTIIACLKLGLAYIPIETNYPLERVSVILSDCKAKFLITENKFEINFNYDVVNLVDDTSLLAFSSEDILINQNVNNIIYIMYTSGTTGTPKGVAINNSNIVSLVKNTNYIKFMPGDRMSQTGSIMFDASTFEYWGALLNGLTLYLIKKDVMLNPFELEKYIKNNKITIMFITSALFNQLVEHNASMFEDVRVILTGGEVLSVKHMNKLLKTCPNIELFNVYGPTETTTFATFYKINNFFEKNIPIGKPLSNKMCYILDKKNRLLPIGIEGELTIGGDGVSKGYIKREDLNTTKFIFDKFRKTGKLYKTGDISYIDEYGNVNFVGRIDNQIKIRGFRIELDEIKAQILNSDKIKDCYTFIIDKDGEKNIAAAYTINDKLEEDELKEYLNSKLPYYMVPKYFIKLDKLPLNKNGKVDGKKVKELLEEKYTNFDNEINDESYSGIYLELYNLFSEVLNKKNIQINDNFFEIGGDSILAIKFITMAISKDISVTYADLYKNPSIKKLGDMLMRKSTYISISDGIEKMDYTNINKILTKNKYDDQKITTSNLGNVLLVGATGFLGAHILDEFMKNEEGDIYCIIRKKENMDIVKRLKERLNFFFGNKYDDEFEKRIFVIEGNIESENIVNDKETFKKITKEINTVINAAANVKHFGDEEKFRKINVIGVKNLVNFCIENDKRFIHTSTLSVSGNILETGQIYQEDIPKGTIYDETNLYIGQNLDNIYAYTKFLGEKVVLDAIYNKGLDAKIMRMGNLTGRMLDGKFQPNVDENAFANRLKTFIELSVLPDNILKFYLEFTPIDYAAKAVVLLSKVNNDYNVYHLFNHKHTQMKEVDRIFKSIGINLNHITKKEMTKLIDKYSNCDNGYEKIQGIILDINKNKEIDYNPNIKVVSNFTIEILKKLEFEWPEVKDEYIKKYIKYLYDINFLK